MKQTKLILFILFICTFTSLSAHALRDYKGNRPKRGIALDGRNQTDMDNISLRLEGQHLSRSCPLVIEQKAKNIPPRQCTYLATKVVGFPPKKPTCKPGLFCCDRKEGVINKVCAVGGRKTKDYFTRLLLRPSPKTGRLTCMWEGCPAPNFFQLANESATVADPVDPLKPLDFTNQLEYNLIGEKDPTPPAVPCEAEPGNEECNPFHQTLQFCDQAPQCGDPKPPGPGPAN